MDITSSENIFSQLSLADPLSSRLDIFPTLFAFVVCLLISFLVRSFYIKFGNSIAGKLNLGNIIPILSAIVFLVILVVKSSLALSLGLVGALSIVRFRTPIKEPEELVYLFLSIGIGLGCAAGYVFLTTFIVISLLVIIYFFLSQNTILKGVNEYNLMINWTENNIDLNKLVETFKSKTNSLSLVRYSVNAKSNSAFFIVEAKNSDLLNEIVSELKNIDETIDFTITPPNNSF
tara:strand:- start:536 stop:1234 length:699 start_codon:yes stop_codon:yes gene_type:complete